MNDNTAIPPLFQHLLKAVFGALILVSLTACNGLAQFTAKPDPKPAEPVAVQTPAPEETPADSKPVKKTKVKPSPLYEWNGDGRRISRIVVDTNEQKARFYEGEEEIGWSMVATGVSKHPTPTGQFAVMEKVENKRSNLYGKVYSKGGKVIKRSVKVGRDPIPSGGRFKGASMPYFMRLTYDGIGLHAGPIPRPGRPASHGCIRMPKQMARVLFKNVSHGTAVSIVGKGPSYGNYVEKQRAIAAQAAERRRIAAQKAAQKAAQTPQVAANTGTRATPAPSATASRSEVIESQAQARDTSGTIESPEVSGTSETRLKTESPATAATEQAPPPSTASTPQPTQTPEVTPVPVAPTAPAEVPSPPQSGTPPTAQPVPAPSTPAPALAAPAPQAPASPTPPAPPATVAAPPAAPPPAAPSSPVPASPAPAAEKAAPKPVAGPSADSGAKPEPAAAPPQPKAQPVKPAASEKTEG